jgi:hypothetical protein
MVDGKTQGFFHLPFLSGWFFSILLKPRSAGGRASAVYYKRSAERRTVWRLPSLQSSQRRGSRPRRRSEPRRRSGSVKTRTRRLQEVPETESDGSPESRRSLKWGFKSMTSVRTDRSGRSDQIASRPARTSGVTTESRELNNGECVLSCEIGHLYQFIGRLRGSDCPQHSRRYASFRVFVGGSKQEKYRELRAPAASKNGSSFARSATCRPAMTLRVSEEDAERTIAVHFEACMPLGR